MREITTLGKWNTRRDGPAEAERRAYLRFTEVDQEHTNLRNAVECLSSHYLENRGRSATLKAYESLKNLSLMQFEAEESLLLERMQSSAIREHYNGHKRSHDVLRLSFQYIDEIISDTDKKYLPTLIGLLPAKYVAHMCEWDQEMLFLLSTQGGRI